MQKSFTPLFIILLFFVPICCFAWGKTGHQIVAQIAKSYLTASVKDSVQKHLGNMSFEEASTWMDEVRKDTSLNFMKPWHYVNIEKDKTFVKNKDENIINELELVIAALKSRASLKNNEVNNYLKILFHLVGDLHQPLHVGYGNDKGGNDIKLMYEGKEKNLHWAWDSEIIYSKKITYEQVLKRTKKLSKKRVNKIQGTSVIVWMNEARSYLPKVYTFKNKELDEKYINKNSKVIQQQLMKAGLRLAAILNTAFGKVN